MSDIMAGIVFGVGVMVIVTGLLLGRVDDRVEKTCQGTPWVIEEPLIKKTLTCTVEIKENK